MFRVLSDVLRRFRSDERGNVFILFGASAIPLLLIMGGAVDIARYTRYKVELANAVDAAGIALARQHEDYNAADATTFVTNYVNALNVADGDRFTIPSIAVTEIPNGFHITAQGVMKTIFLPLGNFTKSGGGLSSLTTNLVAEVVNASNRLEVALVFDNTGSMNCGNSTWGCDINDWATPPSSSRIVALKAAANTLLDVLMPDGDPSLYEFIKIGIVPFEGAVNVGYTSNNVPSWVEWTNTASAKYDGQNWGKYDQVANATCTTGANCKYVGHRWIYNKLTTNDSTVKWEGCVEMRAEPYDILDTTPTSATPDTMFVPLLWPDEPDSDNDDDDDYQNNYLNDRTTSNGSAAQTNVAKFNNIGWQSGQKDTTFPYESGPNFGCPRPIVPLTNTKSTLETAITNLVAYYSTGTFIPVGLAWGWHILTPTEPFTQGIGPSDDHYDSTVKAIVLFTDGENYISGTDNHNDSRFSAYNYINQIAGTYRLDDDNTSDAMDALDDKTAELCENVKDGSIRLYTITFGDMSAADEDLMENCATLDDGDRLYYHAPTTDDLEDIFQQIGEDLSDIHLSM